MAYIHTVTRFLLGTMLACSLTAPIGVFAYTSIPAIYTNENFQVSRHDVPTWLYQDQKGGFYGGTETGKLFRQYPITNELGIKLMRFEIDEAFFYITDRGIIWAKDDLIALSIYVSRT